MKLNFMIKNKTKYNRLGILLTFFLVLWVFSSVALGGEKKAVIFIMDRVNYLDLEKGKYPAISQLRDHGAEGLLNVRSKAMFFPKNSESSYLSIGTGKRIELPEMLKASAIGEGLRVNISDALTKEKNNLHAEVGLLGKTARDNGLKIGLVSSSGGDKPFYGALMMAMDEKGVVPFGNISDKLIIRDKTVPGEWKTDNKIMLKEFKGIYQKSDIVIVDYSDSNRVYQHMGNQGDLNQAIARGDQFLGALLKIIDNQTELIFISPNPSRKAVKAFNYSLTPIIIYQPSTGGSFSLTSNNTKRPGIALNIDLVPTIYNYFGLKVNQEIVGEPINIIPKTSKLEGNYREAYLTNLSKARIIVHGLFIILLIYSIAHYKLRKNYAYIKKLCYIILTYPLSALLIGSFVSYNWYIIDSLAVLILAVILGRLFMNLAAYKGRLLSLVLIGGMTSLLIIIESFLFSEVIMGTPFGFNDVFIGGRFYGLNNDIMGIMLGASTLAIFGFLDNFKISAEKSIMIAALYYIILTVVLSPFYGVNVGGSITAMVMLFISLALLIRIEINWKRAVLIVALVMVIQAGISYLDNIFNLGVTHAGKAINSIAVSGMSKVIQIITSKLSQVGMMLVVPPWNLVLVIQIYIIYKYKRKFAKEIQVLQEKYPILYQGSKVLLWGVIIGFLFNDTGVVTSALMLLYLTNTLILLIEVDNFETN